MPISSIKQLDNEYILTSSKGVPSLFQKIAQGYSSRPSVVVSLLRVFATTKQFYLKLHNATKFIAVEYPYLLGSYVPQSATAYPRPLKSRQFSEHIY